MYVDAPFLSVFVKFVVYLLFHPENISSKVDVIENASFNQIKIVIMLVKKKFDEARSFVHRLKISANEPVCSACRRDVTRVIDDSSYKPRWEKPVGESHCFVDLCTDSVFASLHKVSSAHLCDSFKTAGLKCSSHNFLTPLPYHTVYKIAKPTIANCSLCGLSLKHTAAKYCPNPKAVEHHLRENSGFDGHISETDKFATSAI